MKYALLVYSSPELRDIPEDQLESVVGEYEALFREPGVLDSVELQGTESATTVRVRNGEALLSDGPFRRRQGVLRGLLRARGGQPRRRDGACGACSGGPHGRRR
jgi:hypothetical protein